MRQRHEPHPHSGRHLLWRLSKNGVTPVGLSTPPNSQRIAQLVWIEHLIDRIGVEHVFAPSLQVGHRRVAETCAHH